MLKDYISIVLPTKNEKRNLEILLPHLVEYSNELIVIDGHSTDNTVEFAKQYTSHVYLDNKMGKGAALRMAVEKATRPVTVFIDADHSHNPADIPKLIYPIFNGDCDHVSGSRMLGGSDELHGDLNKFMRMVGSDIILLGINYRFGLALTDCQNGFRAIRTDVFKMLGLEENITSIEQEMVIKTLLHQFKMGEVAAHEYMRTFGESKILVRKVAVRYIYSWLKNLLQPRYASTEKHRKLNEEWQELQKKIYEENKEEMEEIFRKYRTSFDKRPFFELDSMASDQNKPSQ